MDEYIMKFNTLAKALKYIELDIDGRFGDGLTIRDYRESSIPAIKKASKLGKINGWEVFLVVGTCGTFVRNARHVALTDSYFWGKTKYIISISRKFYENNIEVYRSDRFTN